MDKEQRKKLEKEETKKKFALIEGLKKKASKDHKPDHAFGTHIQRGMKK